MNAIEYVEQNLGHGQLRHDLSSGHLSSSYKARMTLQ